MSYTEVFEKWRAAKAFVIDGFVCGDFSVPSPEDLADAEAAEEDGGLADFAPCVAFYVYGERGLGREYFIDRTMIENGERYGDGFHVVYYDGKPLEVEPLFSSLLDRNTSNGRLKMVCDECGSENVLCDAYAQWDIESQNWEIANTFDKGAFCPECDGDATIDAVLIEEKR